MNVNLKKEVQDSWDKFKNFLQANEDYDSATEEDWPILLQEFKDFLKNKNKKVILVEDYLIINKARQVLGTKESQESLVVSDGKIDPWIDDARSSIDWNFWSSYEKFLRKADFPRESIRNVSKDIDSILDKSGNPKEESDAWERRGLVMGNVQSGKTLNFIGLMNKAVDVGYKVIILIGATNSNSLRTQTQVRVDEGFTGFDTSEFFKGQKRVDNEVGKERNSEKRVIPMTTRDDDFNSSFAKGQFADINAFSKDTVLFVTKKNINSLKKIHNWLLQDRKNAPEDNVKLPYPLLLIDDEADWASVNTKKEEQDPAGINKGIRKILNLFNKSTYVSFSATPFANMLIDHEAEDLQLGKDLYPKDFIIKLSQSSNYVGQEHYFPNNDNDNDDEEDCINIISKSVSKYFVDQNKDHKNKRNPDTSDRKYINRLPDCLKEAIRCFVINNSIRASRGDKYTHNSMLINVTPYTVLIDDVAGLITPYLEDVRDMFANSYKMKSNDSEIISLFKKTFETHYKDIEIHFDDLLEEMHHSLQKIKVIAVHGSHGNKEAKAENSLNYEKYKDKGLSVIAVGGYILSRGLTLEGLNVSYFVRTTKTSDTITQMCRWYGYRDTYKDLCKLFIDEGSRKFLVRTTNCIDDVYKQLEDMSKKNLTPLDFGMKLLEDPEAKYLITSKSKMRYAKSSIFQVNYWKKPMYQYIYKYNDKTNSKNLEITDDFISTLVKNKIPIKNAHPVHKFFENVSYDEVIGFISDTDLVSSGALTKSLMIDFVQLMKDKDCPLFKVILMEKTQNSSLAWEKDNKVCDNLDIYKANNKIILGGYELKTYKRRMYEQRDQVYYRKLEMGDGKDERILYTDQQIQDLLKKERESSSEPIVELANKRYMDNQYRDYPVLMIYPFNLSIPNDDGTVTIPFSKPTIGYKLSFPNPKYMYGKTEQERKDLENTKKVSCLLDTVAQGFDHLQTDDEGDEDDDDE